MPLTSTDFCPACAASVVLTQQDGAFTCPACGCRFRTNVLKWIFAIPAAAALSLGVWWILRLPPITIAGIVPVLIGVAAIRIPNYLILSEKASPEVTARAEARKKTHVSRWFLLLLGGIMVINILVFVLSMLGYF